MNNSKRFNNLKDNKNNSNPKRPYDSRIKLVLLILLIDTLKSTMLKPMVIYGLIDLLSDEHVFINLNLALLYSQSCLLFDKSWMLQLSQK